MSTLDSSPFTNGRGSDAWFRGLTWSSSPAPTPTSTWRSTTRRERSEQDVGPPGRSVRTARVAGLPARLSRAPVVSIASIRMRARGAESELVLACDVTVRLAREHPARPVRGRNWFGPGRRSDGPPARPVAAARSKSSCRRRSRRPARGAVRIRQRSHRRPSARRRGRSDQIASRVARSVAIARTKSDVDPGDAGGRPRATASAGGVLQAVPATRRRRSGERQLPEVYST
jgi:hypothetical protein